MNFKQQLSNYILGNLETSDLPKVGIVGLESGLDSESLIILAGLSEKDNLFEIDAYFKKALDELEIQLPDKRTAAIDVITYYADLIKNKQIDSYLGIEKIVDEVLYKTDLFDKSEKYVYDYIGFEKIYGLYDTCCELECADRPRDKEKTNDELIEDCKRDIIIEIKKWLAEWGK
jgi:hypothetical protein